MAVLVVRRAWRIAHHHRSQPFPNMRAAQLMRAAGALSAGKLGQVLALSPPMCLLSTENEAALRCAGSAASLRQGAAAAAHRPLHRSALVCLAAKQVEVAVSARLLILLWHLLVPRTMADHHFNARQRCLTALSAPSACCTRQPSSPPHQPPAAHSGGARQEGLDPAAAPARGGGRVAGSAGRRAQPVPQPQVRGADGGLACTRALLCWATASQEEEITSQQRHRLTPAAATAAPLAGLPRGRRCQSLRRRRLAQRRAAWRSAPRALVCTCCRSWVNGERGRRWVPRLAGG